ncbi:MAG: hypothetical protein KF862_28275 [Chitinophagaceae bacterium]|nr:hypothetical protein [Chitinophagaceae bacterium]
MNLKNTLALMLILGIEFAYSQNQNVIPPSPNSSALGKYVDNPVSLYTGTPDIHIPLYEMKLKNFTLPIGLSYHAAGIKVEEAASNIGLGFVLAASGVIARAVKDIPDDYKAPYCPDTWNGAGVEPDCRNGIFHTGKNIHDVDIIDAYNQDLSNNDYSLNNIFARFFNIELNPFQGFAYKKLGDSEPDIFYFNFCGKSGRFVFQVINGVRTIKLLSDYDLKITHTLDIDGKINQFEITDDLGNIYLFSAVEESRNLIESNGFPSSFEVDQGVRLYEIPSNTSLTVFNSSWYLTKITTPYQDIIDFTYADEVTNSLEQGVEQTLFNLSTDYETYDPNINWGFPLIAESRTVLNGKRLSTIENENFKIVFESALSRQDMWGYDAEKFPKAITGLTIYSKQPTLTRIKRYAFTQDYFESPVISSFAVGSYVYYYNAADDPSTVNDGLRDNMNIFFKRLRLRNIIEYGMADISAMPPVSFEYKYDGFPGYSASERLPYRFSYQQDLWGYYNGASGNTKSLIPKLYVYPNMFTDSRRFSVYKRNIYTGSEYTLAGANRLPSASLMDIGVLTKINYPTGGYTKYEYEPHVFRDGNEEFTGGGIRIKKITKNDGINDIIYNYSYLNSDNTSSGNIVSMPVYAICDGSGMLYPINGTQSSYRANSTRFSQPQAPLGNTKGSNIGYRKVIEYISGNGKIEYEYSVPATWYERNDAVSPTPQADCSTTENGTCDNLYAATEVYDLFPHSYLRSGFFDLSMNPATINSFPFPENPNYDWNRGYLLSKKTYNETSDIVKSEIFSYNIWYRNAQTTANKVYGLKFGKYYPRHANPASNDPMPVGSIGGCFRVAKYSYLTDVQKVLASKTETDYQVGTGNTISKTTTYRYDGLNHLNQTQINEQISNGDELVTKLKYPYDYTFNGPGTSMEGVSILRQKSMYSIPVETSFFVKKSGVEYLKTSNLTTYLSVDNMPLIKREWKIETPSLLSDFTPSSLDGTTGIFTKDFRYTEKVNIIQYDDQGNILTQQKANDFKISYQWGYNNTYPVAEVSNAQYFDAVYNDQPHSTALTIPTGLNEATATLTTYDGTIELNLDAHPGKTYSLEYSLVGPVVKSGTLCASSSSTPCQSNHYQSATFNDMPAGTYTLYLYYYGSDPDVFRRVSYTYPRRQLTTPATQEFFYEGFEENGNATATPFAGKKYHTGDYTVPFTMPNSRSYKVNYRYLEDGAWKSITKSFTNNMTLSEGSAIDEVRVYPVDALMTTYTYDPLIGMTSRCDASNRITYYEYDGFGRLLLVKDQDRNILKKICYNYTGQPESCPPSINAQQSQSFRKNNCTGCQVGSLVTYTVPANTYRSNTSQADADQQALDDIAANGQAYANSHGTCGPPLNAVLNATSNISSDVYITLTNNCTGTNYNYTLNANSTQTLGSFPSGTYTVYMSSSAICTYMINGYSQTSGSGVNFFNIVIDGSASVWVIN